MYLLPLTFGPGKTQIEIFRFRPKSHTNSRIASTLTRLTITPPLPPPPPPPHDPLDFCALMNSLSIKNAKSEMPTGRTHRCLRTVHYFCRRLTSLIRYSYLSLSLRLSEEMIRLKSYVVCPSDIFPANAHTFAKMLFPLDKNIALIDGNFMSFCRQQRQALFDCQLSHERARFSLLKSINGRFRNAFACD